MIEVIYKDENQETGHDEADWNLPKNIRQIGLISRDYRIYIEDYVYTFLHRAALSENQEGENTNCLAVLLGGIRWHSGNGIVFIRGALLADGEEITEEHIEMTQNMWQTIHEEQEKYFEGQEIVGWFLAGQSLSMEPSELIRKVHRDQFGSEKILMLMDTAEQEEVFFRYENNFLVRQDGYYIYYEKNVQMQNYMLEKMPQMQNEPQETVQDDAVKAFRALIRKKKNEKETAETEEAPSVFSYAAAACLVVALAVVGVRFYRNYQAGQQLEDRTREVSAELKQQVPSAETVETPTPQITPSPTAAPEQAAKKTEQEKETAVTAVPTEEPASEEEEQIYKEESDARKAQRRIQENRKNSEEAAAQTQESYTIRPGDTLYQISIAKYGTMEKVADICRVNGISEDETIYPGQIIVLP